jgi:hypothetical protein
MLTIYNQEGLLCTRFFFENFEQVRIFRYNKLLRFLIVDTAFLLRFGYNIKFCAILFK